MENKLKNRLKITDPLDTLIIMNDFEVTFDSESKYLGLILYI